MTDVGESIDSSKAAGGVGAMRLLSSMEQMSEVYSYRRPTLRGSAREPKPKSRVLRTYTSLFNWNVRAWIAKPLEYGKKSLHDDLLTHFRTSLHTYQAH